MPLALPLSYLLGVLSFVQDRWHSAWLWLTGLPFGIGHALCCDSVRWMVHHPACLLPLGSHFHCDLLPLVRTFLASRQRGTAGMKP